MSASVIQRSFAGGEIAPALYGRGDQTKYQTGLKTCRNLKIKKHGGATNREGSRFVAEVKTSSLATFMMKFVYSDDQTYIVEVGNGYFRFYRNPSPYTSPGQIVVSGVAAYNALTAYVLADLVVQGGVNYYCIAATTGNAPPNATYWYPLTGAIYEIPTPYATADLARLQFFQSKDVVTILHPSYDPRELTRTGHTAWKLQVVSYMPSIAAPTMPANNGAAGAGGDAWVVTSIKSDTFEESLKTAVTESSALATAGAPITITWTDAGGALEYNVYKRKNGLYGYIGTGAAGATGFVDNGINPDMTLTPPISRNPFSGASNRPSTGTYYQQRLVESNSLNEPEKIFASRTAMFKNFTISSPLQDDDAVTFTIAGNKVAEVRHLVDLGVLVVLTQSGEYIVEGDANGVFSATQPPNPRRVGSNGASYVMPVVVNDSILYMQGRGSVMRDLRYTVEAQGQAGSYKGRDLTVFSTHLFTNKTIVRNDYAQIPDSIVWAVRSDGVLLGLTYLPEHEVWGWHRHDTDGTFEDVCVIPEGSIDAVYVIVNRTIDGSTKRYIERLPSRDFTDIRYDALFADSHLSYDGRNTGSTELTLFDSSGGWTVDDTLTIIASSAQFIAGDVGNDYEIEVDGETIRVNITAFNSATDVSGSPRATVPAAIRGVPTTTWTRCVDVLAGLDHLEAKEVSVLADGNVLSSPYNPQYSTITVSGGSITLGRPYGVIHVGLPYISDFATLDIDAVGEQIRDRKKDITHISLIVEASRGIFAGNRFPEDIPDDEREDEDDLLEGLNGFQPTPVTNYGQPWPLETGLIEMPISATWNAGGAFVVRQVDPLPLTILSAIPSGAIGG